MGKLEKALDTTLDNALGDMGILNGTLEKLISAVIILVVGWIVIKIAMRFLKKIIQRSALDDVLHTFIINSAKVVCWIFLIITILSAIGVPTTTFITVVGACGAAVALALKDSLSNFAGGVLIMMNKPFKKDDIIEAAGVSGRVKKIDLLFSTLVTFDNQVITVPNGLLSNQVVINRSTADLRRIDCQFGIGYNADINKAKDVIRKIIDKSDYFLHDPEPIIGVAAHGESAVEIDALVWCKTEDYFTGKYYLLEQVKHDFDDAGIEIPYPQVTVHYAHEDVQSETDSGVQI